ncbi:hypothetical protein Bbelb_089700 [Branchiostoma belcheri]|nr:hypothetical protein Bbelb_089700 [Branchiostoma belcheri]
MLPLTNFFEDDGGFILNVYYVECSPESAGHLRDPTGTLHPTPRVGEDNSCGDPLRNIHPGRKVEAVFVHQLQERQHGQPHPLDGGPCFCQFSVSLIICGHTGPNAVKFRTPVHGLGGCGGRKRRLPFGGRAYGIPRYWTTGFRSLAGVTVMPLTCPYLVITGEEEEVTPKKWRRAHINSKVPHLGAMFTRYYLGSSLCLVTVNAVSICCLACKRLLSRMTKGCTCLSEINHELKAARVASKVIICETVPRAQATGTPHVPSPASVDPRKEHLPPSLKDRRHDGSPWLHKWGSRDARTIIDWLILLGAFHLPDDVNKVVPIHDVPAVGLYDRKRFYVYLYLEDRQKTNDAQSIAVCGNGQRLQRYKKSPD